MIYLIVLFLLYYLDRNTNTHTKQKVRRDGSRFWQEAGQWRQRGNMFIFSSFCRECVLGAEGTELWLISSVSAIPVCLVFWLPSTSFALQAQTAPLEILLLYTAGAPMKIFKSQCRQRRVINDSQEVFCIRVCECACVCVHQRWKEDRGSATMSVLLKMIWTW